MANTVTFKPPTQTLGISGAEFVVKQDGEKLGTLTVSKGAVRWLPKGAAHPHKLKWAKFKELMEGGGK